MPRVTRVPSATDVPGTAEESYARPLDHSIHGSVDSPAERGSRPAAPVGEPSGEIPQDPGQTESTSEGDAGTVPTVWNPLRRLSAVSAPEDKDPVRIAGRRLRSAERSRRARERRDQRRFTAHSRQRRRVWVIGGSAVVALALFVVAGVFTPIMAVREVQVAGVSRMNAEQLSAALSRFEGVPLALVNEQDVHRALEPFPLIQRYAIERIPPHTLIVRIEERDPVIALERDGQFVLVDPAGVLVATATERPEGVPLGSGTVIDTASPAFRAAATVVRDMPVDLRAQLATLTASSGQDIEFSLTSGTRVKWGDESDTQRKAAVLRAMLASIGTVSVVDVASPESPVFLQ
ncbi:FtsQ-type POTRA domain-containing protein [Leucobacter sp. W1153]|uniref:FtsQ-type POTRA domain-containing protein n=1 Tax=Leucobacter sp. W1153 TaxID=3439064 RepID=UPI003F38CFCA